MNKNMLCSRCHKNPAVFFISKIDGDKTTNEGLCIKCAMELNIGPVKQIMDQMGISEDEMNDVAEQMNQMMENPDGIEGFQPGGALPLSFLQGMFPEKSDDTEDGSDGSEPEDTSNDGDNTKGKKRKGTKNKKRKYLNLYCTDLTERAREGKLDRIIGRDKEIYRTIQILCRRTKNNPCLIGEPGVGKTAIAEGLALKIAAGDVPAKIADKEIHLLDLTALVAGTQFRGQFESRIKGLIEEVKNEGNIILFIDEVHNLVGTGDSEGTMNAANILKPALSRGEIQVIGATTFNEYRNNIEKDAALERRFQPVKVEEPSINDTYDMLLGIKKYYEDYHKVKISDDLVYRAVTLSERYITDRFLPDKAIDLVDEAMSKAKVSGNTVPQSVKNMEAELEVINQKKEEAVRNEDYKSAMELRDEGQKLAGEIEAAKINWSKNNESAIGAITADDIAEVVSKWTKIPLSRLSETETQRLMHLEDVLHGRVIGQDGAVTAVSKAIRRARAGLKDPSRPIGTFLFLGPTGVGKTELTKALSEAMFDDENAVIRLDMSEYMESHSVSKLIGSPPGYVGFDDGGQLTEQVRRRPYSVVLFDEIEKAHPDVYNLLLQLMDDGRLTDSQGRTVSFKNTIIIMTSNVGVSELKTQRTLGFGGGRAEEERKTQEILDAALRRRFKPEFLNRIDVICTFNHLTKEDISKIAMLLLKKVDKKLSERNIKLYVTQNMMEYILEKGYDPEFGARPLRRVIEQSVEDAIAESLLSGQVKDGDKVEVDFDQKVCVRSKM